jgi:hypothetical protein
MTVVLRGPCCHVPELGHILECEYTGSPAACRFRRHSRPLTYGWDDQAGDGAPRRSTFREAGFSAPIPSQLPRASVGKRCATSRDLSPEIATRSADGQSPRQAGRHVLTTVEITSACRRRRRLKRKWTKITAEMPLPQTMPNFASSVDIQGEDFPSSSLSEYVDFPDR